MKNRSSISPTASIAARRTSMHAPVTQSTGVVCGGDLGRELRLPRTRWRSARRAATGSSPASGNGRTSWPAPMPSGFRMVGPMMPARGLRVALSSSAASAPSPSTASGLSSSTNGELVSSMPRLLLAENPALGTARRWPGDAVGDRRALPSVLSASMTQTWSRRPVRLPSRLPAAGTPLRCGQR